MTHLTNLVNNTLTDKDTVHSYLDLYHNLLEKKQETATHILEVGIHLGGSIKLWKDFFHNATVYGLDICLLHLQPNAFAVGDPRISVHVTDAYNETWFRSTFLDAGIRFDMMLDDGPHTLGSMQQFIRLYSQVMKSDGILIIEDVQSPDWLPHLVAATPAELQPYIKTYDLRHVKGRYDDLVFTIDKTQQ
jgi:hypothetical protein